jgi:hypothetical protein
VNFNFKSSSFECGDGCLSPMRKGFSGSRNRGAGSAAETKFSAVWKVGIDRQCGFAAF